MTYSKKLTVFAATAAVFLSPPSFAGEVKGSNGGEYKDVNGRSICAFSGLNDEYYIDDDLEAMRVQSYGQLVRQGAIDPSMFNGPSDHPPILECNPSTGVDLHD
ncbi:hypothetical protein [Allopontixanthobacter sp.]|uniref:hypothetical protein n=1 Tax=Allopontixanthobacter sp. TaxID=2906452 RepID=UPI002AB95F01|nr:hypothetical protein [Allopontixanthobacter sp.]MDZ4307597.1 hypothetical protein [Allopontixanthobacter sp.]